MCFESFSTHPLLLPSFLLYSTSTFPKSLVLLRTIYLHFYVYILRLFKVFASTTTKKGSESSTSTPHLPATPPPLDTVTTYNLSLLFIRILSIVPSPPFFILLTNSNLSFSFFYMYIPFSIHTSIDFLSLFFFRGTPNPPRNILYHLLIYSSIHIFLSTATSTQSLKMS